MGTVETNTASAVTFAHASDVGALLVPGAPYYLEVLTGALQGERFDVDVAATIAGEGAVALKLGPGTLSTRPVLAGGALAGARGAIRPHLTLARLQSSFRPGLRGRDLFLLADGVWVFENGDLAFYFLRADGATWNRVGSAGDYRGKVIAPDVSVLVETKSAAQSWIQTGQGAHEPVPQEPRRGLPGLRQRIPGRPLAGAGPRLRGSGGAGGHALERPATRPSWPTRSSCSSGPAGRSTSSTSAATESRGAR